jgi:glycosyltransferase involved in cell wall biosynthesis
MLASVVVNNHNYGRFLRAAIESVLAQTHPDVEIVVVDDGSTDNSRDIIAGYGDRVIPVYQENSGQGAAVNAGVARCRGDVIFILDSDDVLEPRIVEHVVATFAADPTVAWVMFRLEVIEADGTATGELRPTSHIPRRDGDLRANILGFPFDMVRTATSGNAFSATALRKILPVPTAPFFTGADWYISPLIGLFGRCVFLDEVGGGYRLHGSNDNWFERQVTIDLSGLRRDLRFMQVSAANIRKFAAREGLGGPREILSVSYIAARFVSLKLAPAGHPMVDDTPLRLLALGYIATMRRFDVRWQMKVLFLGWFATMAVAPRPLAARLAQIWYFPGKRGKLNQTLGLLHAPEPAAPLPASHS